MYTYYAVGTASPYIQLILQKKKKNKKNKLTLINSREWYDLLGRFKENGFETFIYTHNSYSSSR